jgi:hypothetical protein
VSDRGKEDKKPAGIAFIQALNTPKFFSSSTESSWGLIKSKMKKSEVEDTKSDGSDVFQAKEQENKEIKRDGLDSFHGIAQLVAHPEKIDIFEEKTKETEVREKNKTDKWERHYIPTSLPGEDILVNTKEDQINFASKDIFTASSTEHEGLFYEKNSALYIQLSELVPGFEKKIIPFEKREVYLKEIEQYIEKKKKSLNRLYNLKDPRQGKIKFLLDRGFNVFSQSLNELKFYLRDDSHIHLTLARQLSFEGNNLFLKAREELSILKIEGGRNV